MFNPVRVLRNKKINQLSTTEELLGSLSVHHVRFKMTSLLISKPRPDPPVDNPAGKFTTIGVGSKMGGKIARFF